MTRSALAEPLDAPPLLGSQRPRIFWTPPGVVSSAGREAVELAASAGLILDDWQAWLLEVGLAEDARGLWLAFEIAELLARQNGKGGVLEAVALAALYLFGDPFTGWSAHEFKTCREGFLRVRALIEGSDDLRRRAKKPRASHGEEELELLSGPRLKFMARSMGAGRGFTGRRLILDEAQHLGDAAMAAILPTMSAQPNPQVWYAATAPDPKIAPCEVLARLRRRALKGIKNPRGGDPSLVYAEWSIDPHMAECSLACTVHDDPSDPRSVAKANPALGKRISMEYVEKERAALSAADYARERLGVGNWPVADAAGWEVIGEQDWRGLADLASAPHDPVCFAADVTPDMAFGAIAVAGADAGGLLHVEVVDHRPKTGWIVDRLVELHEKWAPCGLVVDPSGAAGNLITSLEKAGFTVVAPSAPPPAGGRALVKSTFREMAQACGAFYRAVTDTRSLRHLDQPMLTVALAGAQKRPLGDAWAWARQASNVDISPLVAVTLAAWGHANRAHLADGKTPQPDIF